MLLTNLQVTTAGSKQRAVRLPAAELQHLQPGLHRGRQRQAHSPWRWTWAATAPSTGAAALATLPFTLKTGNLAAAINAYLAGKSGDVDVPLRFFVAPDAAGHAGRLQASAPPSRRPGRHQPQPGRRVGAASVDAYKEGDIVTLQATLSNASSQDSGPLTAAFFATAEGWGDWYIGSAFFANIPAGGSAQVSILWDTTGFGTLRRCRSRSW